MYKEYMKRLKYFFMKKLLNDLQLKNKVFHNNNPKIKDKKPTSHKYMMKVQKDLPEQQGKASAIKRLEEVKKKFINLLMRSGEKCKAHKLFTSSLNLLEKKSMTITSPTPLSSIITEKSILNLPSSPTTKEGTTKGGVMICSNNANNYFPEGEIMIPFSSEGVDKWFNRNLVLKGDDSTLDDIILQSCDDPFFAGAFKSGEGDAKGWASGCTAKQLSLPTIGSDKSHLQSEVSKANRRSSVPINKMEGVTPYKRDLTDKKSRLGQKQVILCDNKDQLFQFYNNYNLYENLGDFSTFQQLTLDSGSPLLVATLSSKGESPNDIENRTDKNKRSEGKNKSTQKNHLYDFLKNHILYTAIENVKPPLELRSVRKGGTTYQVPAIVGQKKQERLAIKWIIESARKRKNKNKKGDTFSESLVCEILEAFNKTGQPRQKRDEMLKIAQYNRAYTLYRWW